MANYLTSLAPSKMSNRELAQALSDVTRSSKRERALIREARRREDQAFDWLTLADEVNDLDADPFVESHYDPAVVRDARRGAERFLLPWPPAKGDYDAAYDGQYGHDVRNVMRQLPTFGRPLYVE